MNCPICHHEQNDTLLKLNDFPIYQHPMADISNIPLPHAINLEYLICAQCAHAFQQNYDRDILENIYAHHYYTPSPENIGDTFRNEFIHFIQQNDILKKVTSSIFEIGCSSGEVLFTLKSLNADSNCDYLAIEPNEETVITAKNKGLIVKKAFFTEKTAHELNFQADIIYSRHVIEHIFDFEDFFKAIAKVSHNTTQLILETPSLDWSIAHASIMPFHVEHVHVFSQRSLVSLANKLGWFEEQSNITVSGNLIISFTQTDKNKALPLAPKNKKTLQKQNNQNIKTLQNICKDKQFIFWGAGSGAVTLLALTKLQPLCIVDGNSNKVGKYFCGLNFTIGYAPEVIKELITNNKDINLVMIISSSFYQEIRSALVTLGWRGDIYSPYENNID